MYLCLQFTLLCQLVFLAVRVILNSELEQWRWVGYVGVVLGGIFAVFVLNLAVFHAFLIVKNITTWEQLSWKKISYLQDWDKQYGSPFDLGPWQNMKLVFMNRLSSSDFYLWKMPYWVPAPPSVQLTK